MKLCTNVVAVHNVFMAECAFHLIQDVYKYLFNGLKFFDLNRNF